MFAIVPWSTSEFCPLPPPEIVMLALLASVNVPFVTVKLAVIMPEPASGSETTIPLIEKGTFSFTVIEF